MKSYSLILSIITLFFIAPVTISAHQSNIVPEYQTPPRWEKLGQRRVNRGLDRDEIYVTASEGRFTSLRLKAELAPINLHRVVIHFRNGTTQSFNVNQTMRAGTVSRNIDLPGNRRIITKVVFWYDTRNLANRRGRMELWGRH